uniref:Uncharacterized protein n=1 Tax=Anguilla anguilla TaxID=7936 RepID=A0A0E9XSV0_ANGAN
MNMYYCATSLLRYSKIYNKKYDNQQSL